MLSTIQCIGVVPVSVSGRYGPRTCVRVLRLKEDPRADAELALDHTRLYCTGVSMGGAGAWQAGGTSHGL
jgi:hypothetical protein